MPQDAPAQPQPVPIDAPLFYASSISVQGAGNDFTLTFSRGRPVVGKLDGEDVMLGEAVAMITLAPGTLKDLMLLIQNVIEPYERDYGVIRTPYTETRGKTAKKAR